METVEEHNTNMNSFPTKFQSKVEMAKSMTEEEKLYRYNGVLYPVVISPEENLRALETVEARSNDIMLVAYPKCGFNWMVAILRKIITAGTGEKVESKMAPLLEFFGPETLQMLVVFRNPKDTLVSFYHFSNKNPVLPTAETWDQFFMDFISGEVPWGSYFDHALAWEKRMYDSNIMIITFEELKHDLSGSVQKVAEFFGFKLTDAQIQTIAEESTFDAMKKGSKDSHGQMGNVFFRKGG
ncbi:hypothetical protein AMELA_G00274200 [Ameiurus melas]|uniref:Sulfotransferase n=1 Tax=Ameiurus melas TaxID=219545 RepID=A0A7J5ZPH2_AMEME|nr:hypothetical protein AMELA_G00274200 [Ameiurus melas]